MLSVRIAAVVLPLVLAVEGCIHNTRSIPPQAQKVAFEGQTVLGTMENRKLTEARKNEIIEKVRTLYDDRTLKPRFLSGKDGWAAAKASGPGATARGVVIDEQKDELTLDIDPCTGAIAMFRQPYIKRDAGEVTCNGKKYPRKEIEQRSSDRK